MDKKIITLAEENKVSELVETLKNITNEEVCKLIERKVLKGRNDTFTLVRAVLLGSPPDDPASIERRFDLYKYCIGVLQQNDMNNKMASELVGLLMSEADALPGASLAELAGLFVDGIKGGNTQSGKALELLPKILSCIATQETISYAGNNRSGADYKGHILNSLCSCKWEPQTVIHLATMFRDVPLTSDELRFVIEKIVRMFRDLDLQDIPAVVYQLLLLSTKGHKKLVLEGIINYFTEQDVLQKPTAELEFSEDLLDTGAGVEALRQTEGTVILHVSFAVKQHHDLGREFVRCLKSNQQCSATKILAPFNLALCLSLARIHRFEDQIYDFVKGMVLKSYRDSERLDQSHWVQEVVTESGNMEDFVLDTVHNSTFGWDHVVQGLVQLGFILMDAFGPRAAFGRIDVQPPTHAGPSQKACQLGAKILLNTFKAHQMVRGEILEQIFNRVVTKATAPVTHYLDLLGDTVYAAPQMLMDSTTKVREMFDYLSFLSPGSAEGLLRAVQPILKLSMTLKDALILVLRKAMFSRQLDARKIGASGFLVILKQFRVLGGIMGSQASQPSFSSSQVQVNIHVPYNPSSNEALCLEILGNLRRCLSQQADVRLLLYQGMIDVLSRNTQLKNAILDMLLTQLKGYYETNSDVNPPLKLEPCILAQGDQVYLAEPLAHLLSCIQLCLVKSTEIRAKELGSSDDDDDDDDEDLPQSRLEKIMDSLTSRMISSEMEDFELDKSADYSLANSVGVRNNIFAILVLGTYEVLMEYNFVTGNLSENSVQHVLELFDNHKKLSDTLKEKVGQGAGGKKGKPSAKTPHSLLSLKMVASLLDVLMGETAPSNRDAAASLRQSGDLLRYTVTVAQQKLQQVQERAQCDGHEGKDKARVFTHCCSIGRLLLVYYIEQQKGEGSRGVRERQITTQVLESLVSLVTIVTQHYPTDITRFLVTLENGDVVATQKDGRDMKLYQHVKRFQRLVVNVLNADDDNRSMKDLGSLLSIVFQLSKHLSPSSPGSEQTLAWVKKLCTEQNIDDLSLCKSLLSALLSMTQRLQSCPLLIRDLAQDIHSRLGDIDQDVEVDGRTHFTIVTVRSAAPTVLTLLLQHCERELDDTDWVIARIRADNAANTQTGDDSPEPTQRDDHEKSVCTRLGILVGAFHEFVQAMLPVGACTELLMKLLTRMYGTLTSLVKFYIGLCTQNKGLLSQRFEKLVKLSGTRLTQYCYALITYIQTSESEQIQNVAPDKGKKKADKKKGKPNNQSGKAYVMKQAKTIPNLIFAIEQYERYLIQLTKKSKVNLMEHMKQTTSRDFRINIQVLTEALDNQSSSDDDLSDDDKSDNETVQDASTNQCGSGEDSGDSDRENEAPPQNTAQTEEIDEPPVKKSRLGTKNRKLAKPRS